MTRHPGKIRRAFWWCAAVDEDVMLDPKCPRVDHIKYAIVGTLVCITTAIGTIGWMDIAALVFTGNSYRIPIAITLGLLMGSLVLTMERMLIVSIPAKVSLFGRIFAFEWRCVLAGFTAAIITLPVVLNYYHTDILNSLDDEKHLQMQQKRNAIDKTYNLSGAAKGLEQLDAAIASNLQRSEDFPNWIREIGTKLATCNAESRRLENGLRPRIAAATNERRALGYPLSIPTNDAYLRKRVAALSADIARWNGRLVTKSQACTLLEHEFEGARKGYLSHLEGERRLLLDDRHDQQTALKSNQRRAELLLKKSDEVVDQYTDGNLSAQLRTLVKLAAQDTVARLQMFLFFAFFFLVDMAPIVAKLLSRSIYERLLGGREDKLIAKINSEVAVARAQAEVDEIVALAEKEGFQAVAFRDGGQTFKDYAEASTRYRAAEAEMLLPFKIANTVADAFERGQNRIDELEKALPTNRDTTDNIERVREMLREAMRRSPHGLRRASNPVDQSANVPRTNEPQSNLARRLS